MTLAIALVLTSLGALGMLIGSLAVLRMPDLPTRLTGAATAVTIGGSFMFLAIAVRAPEPGIAIRALAGIVFFFLTTPVSTQLLARAWYRSGGVPWEGTVLNELADAEEGAARRPGDRDREWPPRP